MTRKSFIQAHDATCRNWTWSWSFVNHHKKLIIFGEWNTNREGNGAVILDEDWEFSRRGKKQPGYGQAVAHIRLITEQGYQLKTFPMVQSQADGSDPESPAKIESFTPYLSSKHLSKRGHTWIASDMDIVERDFAEVRGLEEVPAPASEEPISRKRKFKARRRRNRQERDAANRALGRAGELLVLDHERNMLINRGRPDLARQVRDVAGTEGDGAGYDILSFDPRGNQRHLEVKTTNGSKNAPFLISANEVAFSAEHSATFELIRVFDFEPNTGKAAFFRRSGAVGAQFRIEPTQYEARP